MKKVRIGLIGAGRIGRLHGDNIVRSVPNAELVAVADPMMNDSIRDWAHSLNVENCYDDAKRITEDKSIDAVFICTSTQAHAELIQLAAKEGKHIFCEKPLHTDINTIKESIEQAEKAGVKLQVGFVRRFDVNHKMVHETVKNGKLGKPHIIKVCSRDPDHQPMEYIKTSGGIFLDMTIHDFDMVRYLSCSEVTEVTAYGAVCGDPRYADYDDVDTAIMMLKFENGAIGVIDNSRASHYGYDQRVEVHCDKGCVQDSNVNDNTAKISTMEGVEISKPTWFFLERYNNAFIQEAKEFTDAILNDTEVPVNGKDGLMPVAIAIAAAKSYKEGRAVKISEILN